VGVLKLASDSRKKQVEQYDDQIENWDIRLALREASIRKQFNAMEVALGRLRDQSTWLSGQIASLI
jgi:flagellar hook-associated protein 2